MYKYLNGGCEEDGTRLFSLVSSDRTKDYGHKLERRRFSLNIRKHSFTVRVTNHGSRFLKETDESPSSEIFKSCLDVVLVNLL